MIKENFSVQGMTCSACSAHVEKAVKGVKGVSSCAVSLLTNSMVVEFDENATNAKAICAAVKKGGYSASVQGETGEGEAAENAGTDEGGELSAMKKRLIASLVFMIPLFYLTMGHMLGAPLPNILSHHHSPFNYVFTQLLFTLPIVFINFGYFSRGFKAVINGAPNMDTLVAMGSGAAFIYSTALIYAIGNGGGDPMGLHFESAAMILTLITLGKFLEARAKGRTTDALSGLAKLSPQSAVILKDGAEEEIPISQLQVGDIMVIKQGAIVPADGVCVLGEASFDESALTGESVPVLKEKGSTVMCASACVSGYAQVEAKRVGSKTTLSQMIELVKSAGASKAPIARIADKVSGIFVPVVISIAIISAAAWMLAGQGFYKALSAAIAVLVISCPCALGLATPVAIMMGTGEGARHGVLFKTAAAMETLKHVKTVVMDKTGTITTGKMSVTDVVSDMGKDEFIRLAASIEQMSSHPIAKAIVEAAKGAPLYEASEFETLEGRGVSAVIEGRRCLAGNENYMNSLGIDLSAFDASALKEQGKTPIFLARENRALGFIAVADTLKEDSAKAVSAMKNLNMNVVMLTGDNERTAKAVAAQAGILEVIAGVLPDRKQEEVKRLRANGRVAFIGDGVNDAPALKEADVGIAIGSGTDIAIDSADVVLMRSNLSDAVTAIELSHAVLRNIKENLFWAFFYNAICIPLAAGAFYPLLGWQLSPMVGAAAMSLSSVSVVSNALRLRFFKPSLRDEKIIAKDSKGEDNMLFSKPTTRTVKIEGMMCTHCSGHVKKALEAIPGVTAEVSHETGEAVLTMKKDVPDAKLKAAIEDAGYKFIG
ncbi:MAG: heavy metal translocating P-type ATPase [Clostridiales bacterium]|nr:heavy metal translocating P-type ATPase [Clostridiales bacterium]